MSSTHATRAHFAFTDDAAGTEFRWSGGAYIESGYIAAERGPYERDHGHAVGEFVAQDCRNVWNYETSEPTIPRTLEAFEQACREWMAETADEFPACPICADPIDYCQGHGEDNAGPWVVVLPDGRSVGRFTLSDPLGPVPAAFAYTYERRADAEQVARAFEGAQVEAAS
jgi:hypothetical protein